MPRKSVTTRKGDCGETRLLNNSKIKKSNLRPEVTGTLDEAGAFIGRSKAESRLPYVQDTLYTVQNHLYLLNAELACPEDKKHYLKRKIAKRHIQYLDNCIAFIEKNIELPPKFYLPGQSLPSAELDIARTVVRRAERRVVELSQEETLHNNSILPYLNRLSDLLFLLARYEEFKNDIPYAHPRPED